MPDARGPLSRANIAKCEPRAREWERAREAPAIVSLGESAGTRGHAGVGVGNDPGGKDMAGAPAARGPGPPTSAVPCRRSCSPMGVNDDHVIT